MAHGREHRKVHSPQTFPPARVSPFYKSSAIYLVCISIPFRVIPPLAQSRFFLFSAGPSRSSFPLFYLIPQDFVFPSVGMSTVYITSVRQLIFPRRRLARGPLPRAHSSPTDISREYLRLPEILRHVCFAHEVLPLYRIVQRIFRRIFASVLRVAQQTPELLRVCDMFQRFRIDRRLLLVRRWRQFVLLWLAFGLGGSPHPLIPTLVSAFCSVSWTTRTSPPIVFAEILTISPPWPNATLRFPSVHARNWDVTPSHFTMQEENFLSILSPKCR